jgi:hypothetical protein
VAPVFLILSEPAKSTKVNLAEICSSADTYYCISPYLPSSKASPRSFEILYYINTVNIACDLDEPSFIRVALVVL